MNDVLELAILRAVYSAVRGIYRNENIDENMELAYKELLAEAVEDMVKYDGGNADYKLSDKYLLKDNY